MPLTDRQTVVPAAEAVIELLRCPECENALARQPGEYRCSCGRAYPVRDGVACFVDPRNYAESFGFQWRRYARTQLDEGEVRESELHFRRTTGFRPEDLSGKLVLDVGCGMGRFAEVATRWGARVIGVDLSAAAQVAAQNLSERDFVALQADVFHLPFAPESFDLIYSIGVLHHTPDCELALRTLPRYLKPGGTIAVWLYSGYNRWYRFSDIYRKVTSRMPPQLLHSTLRMAVPFLYQSDRILRRVPIVGAPAAGLIHHAFPVSRSARAEARILDTFDWYSPKYQSKHTYEQIFAWLAGCGLEDFGVAQIPIGARARKPGRSSGTGLKA